MYGLPRGCLRRYIRHFLFSDPCTPNPCLNEGECDLDPGGGYICSCPYGYGGMACATETLGNDGNTTAVDCPFGAIHVATKVVNLFCLIMV